MLLATSRAGLFPWLGRAADTANPIVETTYGRVRGAVSGDVKIFKGIRYGDTTAGMNRFMPPRKPARWTGTRDALEYGPTAPQTVAVKGNPPPRAVPIYESQNGSARAEIESEDCLVLNVCTPALKGGAKRPVFVWLHGGGFSAGSGSGPMTDGASLAHSLDVVVVTINHRLNVLGFTYLREQAGSGFASSGAVGMLDIIAALEWVRDNISQFGGDPNLVTIAGQSGGGRKVATLMSMPLAQGLYHRAIIESGAILRLPSRDDGTRYSDLLLAELGLKRTQARELQSVSLARLLAANAEVLKKIDSREPGYTPNSPIVDSKTIPTDPWDPVAPALSAKVPLLIGWARTEETLYERPTPENLALDEAGLRSRATKRLAVNPDPLIEAYRKAHPEASPWDLYILIATDHPRGAYAREVAKRKATQGAGAAFLYRFDWETPEGGGHMRSPHTVEVPFVFNNIAIGGPQISKMPEAYSLAGKVSASWIAFARSGNPNTPKLPPWPEYSARTRDTMLFNNECRVEQDPDRGPRLIMEQVLRLS